MLTSDLALRFDPDLREDLAPLPREPGRVRADAFAKAWYKLLHRDMGPVDRYLGPWVPEPQLWQDPVPAVDHPLVDDAGHRRRSRRRSSTPACRVAAARLDRLGRGGDVPLAPTSAAAPTVPGSGWSPRRTGRSTSPSSSPRSSASSRRSRQAFNAAGRDEDLPRRPDRARPATPRSRRPPSDGGFAVTVPFTPGRTDATQEQTDVELVRRASSRVPTVSATTSAPARSCRRRRCWSTGPTCWTCPRPR